MCFPCRVYNTPYYKTSDYQRRKTFKTNCTSISCCRVPMWIWRVFDTLGLSISLQFILGKIHSFPPTIPTTFPIFSSWSTLFLQLTREPMCFSVTCQDRLHFHLPPVLSVKQWNFIFLIWCSTHCSGLWSNIFDHRPFLFAQNCSNQHIVIPHQNTTCIICHIASFAMWNFPDFKKKVLSSRHTTPWFHLLHPGCCCLHQKTLQFMLLEKCP